MSDIRVPEDLRRAVARDLRPVRPLASPARRVLRFAPVGLLLFVSLPAFWGWRSNLHALGLGLAWGLSGLQAVVGLVIVGLGLRESIPGRELPRSALAVVAVGAGTLLTWATLETAAQVPTLEPPGLRWRFAWECFYMAAGPGAVAVVVAVCLVAGALPLRPAVAGAFCGLGAALMGDAGARLFCWVSSPAHVLLSHGGAILALTLFGAMAATTLEARRRDHREALDGRHRNSSGEGATPRRSPR